MDELTARIIDTDDVRIWADAFVETFDGRRVGRVADRDVELLVDESVMIAWFANAMETSKRQDRRRLEQRPLLPGEVAEMFAVDVDTVGRWADAGELPSFRTPGGHRRFHRRDIEPMLQTEPSSPAPRGGALVEATIPPHGEGAGGGPPGHPPRGRSGVKGG